MTTQWKWTQAKVRAEKPTQTEWGRWWLWWRWAVLEVVQWLAVKPQGSWQTCLHATRRKRRVIVVWHGTATGNGLWLRKEIQYRAFTKLQSTRESGAFKHSNTHTSSVDTRLSILPLLKAWFNRTTGICEGRGMTRKYQNQSQNKQMRWRFKSLLLLSFLFQLTVVSETPMTVYSIRACDLSKGTEFSLWILSSRSRR